MLRRRLPLVLLALLPLASCRCGGPSVAARYGELVIVQLGPTGRELLSREATLTLPPAFMGTVGSGEVTVRNVGQEEITIASVTRLEGDEAISLDDAVGLSVLAGENAALPVRFAPPQASDATLREASHRAKFSLALQGAREGENELLVELGGTAVARDCYVPAELDFGDVPLRQAVTANLTLENGGPIATTTTVGAVQGADAAAFFVAAAGGTLEVPAGSQTPLPVRFAPLEERDYQASLALRRSDQCPEGVVRLSGRGNEQALSWNPSRLDFGRVPLQETATRELTIVSSVNLPLALRATPDSAEYVVDTAAPTVVPARGRAVLAVRCSPTTLGPRPADLTLTIGELVAHVPLSCIGGGPRIRVDPSPVQFGTVTINTDARRRVLVQNVGTAPPAPGDASNNLVLGLNGALPWFAIVPKNAQTSITEFSVNPLGPFPAEGLPAIAGQNLAEFELSLRATTAGLREADLLVYSNDSVQPIVRVPITATPRLPEPCDIVIDPAAINFGPTPRGAVQSRTLTITNHSAVAGNTCLISGIEMASGSNPAFTIFDPPVPSLLVSQGQSRTIRVGVTVPPNPPDDYLRGTLRFQVGSETTMRTVPVDLLVTRCLAVDPPVLDLGTVQTGCTSASKAVSLYNVCGVPIDITNITTPSTPFRITSSPFGGAPISLAPSQHLSVQVAAAPNMPGPYTGVLQIESNEGGSNFTQNVALRAAANETGQQAEAFVQTQSQVDILLVIDNSCSMADEQAALATNFAAFMSSASQSTADWHIGVVTTDVAGRGALVESPGNPRYLSPTTASVATLFAQKVSVGTSGSGIEQPFQSMSLAVTAPNLTQANAGFLRPDAALAVVIVTDALEQSPNSVGAYVTTLKRAKNNHPELVSVSVVGPFSPAGNGCTTEGLVDDGRFASIVSQTGGVRADICTSNWAMDLRAISQSVFGARRAFELGGTPRGSTSVTVTVDGVPTTAWTFDAASNAIVFQTAPPPGAAIGIDYVTACF
ncbi:MAG: choice-of-anchor D domain-containing protein [Myxococcota bacterium]